jgi:hypothetical protein
VPEEARVSKTLHWPEQAIMYLIYKFYSVPHTATTPRAGITNTSHSRIKLGTSVVGVLIRLGLGRILYPA